MKQYGFYFDAENCIGCHTCHVACKDIHNLAVGENFRTVRTFTTGSGYTPRMYHISLACNHCAAPTCIPACPEDALLKDAFGLVQIDEGMCTGCGDCIDACPYEVIVLLGSGIVGKCDGCVALRAHGEEVACVSSCPQRVLEFGLIDDLRAAHVQEGLVADAAPLPFSDKTSPNVVMRVKDCMDDKDFDEIII